MTTITPDHVRAARRVAYPLSFSGVPREDLQQVALIAAWRAPEGSPGAHIGQLMRNAAVDLVRQETHCRTEAGNLMDPLAEDHDVADSAPGPAQLLLERQQLRLLLGALDELPARNRELVELHYCEDLTLTEVAARWGTTVSAVSQRMSATIRALKTKTGRIRYAPP